MGVGIFVGMALWNLDIKCHIDMANFYNRGGTTCIKSFVHASFAGMLAFELHFLLGTVPFVHGRKGKND